MQDAADALEAVRPMGSLVRAPVQPWIALSGDVDADDAARRLVGDLLGHTPVAVDELVRQSGAPSAVVASVLLELELAGRVTRHAGGRVSSQ